MPGNFHEVPEWILEQWPAPNYVDPVRRTWMPAFASVLPAVSTILIAGRFWLRAGKQSGGFGLDDLFIAIGWLVSLGFSINAIISTEIYDLDRHTWDVNPSRYEGAALCGWTAQVLFLISTSATKASVLLFYRRMVAGTYTKRWLIVIWLALGFLAAYFVGVLLAYCLLCRPLTAYWESYNFDYDKDFTCINGNILSPFVGALSVFTDVYAVIIPCVMLSRVDLDVPRRQKIGLNVIFALGLIVAGFGIARTYYLWKINNDYDTSWNGFSLYIWSLLECHFSVIFACAPALRAIFRRYFGEIMSRTFGSSKTRSHTRSGDKRYTPDSKSLDRPPARPRDMRLASLEQEALHPHVKKHLSRGTLDDVNFYHEDSGAPTPAARSVHNQPIRSADDYETYAMAQLNRHAHNKSLSVTPKEVAELDWNDPQRRYDSDNAV